LKRQMLLGSREPSTTTSEVLDGERWPLEPGRVQAALAAGAITRQQADVLVRSKTIGSHLEILQRDEGYKGFNKAGISEIIRQTDPRRRI
jgi:hypothetical protein